MSKSLKYFILYKPYGVLSQFTQEVEGQRVLGELYDFPKDVYAVGRLDRDSEGLLLLTNDNKLNHRLLNPSFKHERTYWVQVEGQITAEAIRDLRGGVDIRINKKIHHTLPAKAKEIAEPSLPDRDPPIRFRQNIPTSWVEIKLVEGKNRQVRRMCAKVGFPVLRLVRAAIKKIELRDMQVGEVKELSTTMVKRLYEN